MDKEQSAREYEFTFEQRLSIKVNDSENVWLRTSEPTKELDVSGVELLLEHLN
jgi:hypothetical protein